MTTTTRHAAPWTFRRVLAMFTGKPARPGPKHPGLLTGREAVARCLYGEFVQWDAWQMARYDQTPIFQGRWLAEADRWIERTEYQSANHPDRHIAALHGYTPERWDRLPALVQADLRESVVHADGFRA